MLEATIKEALQKLLKSHGIQPHEKSVTIAAELMARGIYDAIHPVSSDDE